MVGKAAVGTVAQKAEYRGFRFTIRVWNGEEWVRFAETYRASYASFIERSLWRDGYATGDVKVDVTQVIL